MKRVYHFTAKGLVFYGSMKRVYYSTVFTKRVYHSTPKGLVFYGSMKRVYYSTLKGLLFYGFL